MGKKSKVGVERMTRIKVISSVIARCQHRFRLLKEKSVLFRSLRSFNTKTAENGRKKDTVVGVLIYSGGRVGG